MSSIAVARRARRLNIVAVMVLAVSVLAAVAAALAVGGWPWLLAADLVVGLLTMEHRAC